MMFLSDPQENDEISLCSLTAGDRQYGVDTSRILEVLGRRDVQRVPLASKFVSGVIPYRGEVLTTISLRALLGLPPDSEERFVVVFGERGAGAEGKHEVERYGLMVDGVGGVVMASGRAFRANSSMLDEASKVLFHGAYQMTKGLLVQLDPDRLIPARLAGPALSGGVHARPLVGPGTLREGAQG